MTSKLAEAFSDINVMVSIRRHRNSNWPVIDMIASVPLLVHTRYTQCVFCRPSRMYSIAQIWLNLASSTLNGSNQLVQAVCVHHPWLRSQARINCTKAFQCGRDFFCFSKNCLNLSYFVHGKNGRPP